MLIGMEKDYLGHLALLSASQQLSIQILESEVYESPLLGDLQFRRLSCAPDVAIERCGP